ncbi:MAG: carboxylating nicotinate-nucleotide diphosphorylase [Coxiellaceae bacterium]|nr:carboxylating nicotinate-nucleotide diphosphorylase [Coxiellaceae bacterium]
MEQALVEVDVRACLDEDIGVGDITAELIAADQMAVAEVISREQAVLCGTAWVNACYQQLDPSVELEWLVKDGDRIEADHVFLRISGRARSILTGERTALNWLQTLSATATVTRQYVNCLADTDCTLLDTRKTVPGLRYAQKYAVRCGNGTNHRLGLYDAFLIKENHIISCGSIAEAVKQARALHADKLVEVEVENLNELATALNENVDVVMLDNFSLIDMQQAVAMNQGRAKLEVSGNVDIDSAKDIAETGVDYISVGALTKNIRAIDLSMRIITTD